MDSNLDVSIFQIDLAYKDKEQNLNLIDKLSDHISSSDILQTKFTTSLRGPKTIQDS